MADIDIDRKIFSWSNSNENILYLTDFLPGQLTNEYKNLWKFDINDTSMEYICPIVEEIHSISDDDLRVLFINNDETCCSGINYTNNQLFEYNLSNNSIDTIFCEYSEFSNNNLPSEHIPISSIYSPDNKKIVYDIETLLISNALNCEWLKNDSTKDYQYYKSYDLVIYDRITCIKKKFKNARYKMWFDDSHLIINPLTVNWDPLKNNWINKYSDQLLLNINTMNTIVFNCNINEIFRKN